MPGNVLALLAGALFLLVYVRLAGHLAPGLLWPVLAAPSLAVCGAACLGWASVWPILGELGKSVVFLIMSAAAVVAVLRLALSLKKTRRFLKSVRRCALPFPVRLEGQSVVVFADKRPVAFTAGLIRPRIFLSSALRDLLDEEELRAVVVHESGHLEARDPLRTLLITFFCDLYLFLPIAPILKAASRFKTEQRADARAVGFQGGSSPLARALRKAQGLPDTTCSALGDLRHERIASLGGDRRKRPVPTARIVLSAGLALLFVFLALRPIPRSAFEALGRHRQSCPQHDVHR